MLVFIIINHFDQNYTNIKQESPICNYGQFFSCQEYEFGHQRPICEEACRPLSEMAEPASLGLQAWRPFILTVESKRSGRLYTVLYMYSWQKPHSQNHIFKTNTNFGKQRNFMVSL